MFKTLVVGTDGSATAEKAVEVAAGLAKGWNATLHVVTAYSTTETGLGAASGAALAETGLKAGLKHEAADQVGQKAVETWGTGIDSTQVHPVAGPAAEAILDTAVSVGADLIVVGSKGMQRRLLGSVPNSVAHGAPCAVLIVKTD